MEHTTYKVLLIEDDGLDQMAFKRFLEDEKLLYDYKIADSVSEAQSMLDSEKFDIIVSDYSLGDGTALDRKQKNLEAIFDAAPIGMLLADENMIIIRVNSVVKQMLHRDYSQIINREVDSALDLVSSTHNKKACECSQACAECTLKKTIRSVLDSGRPIHHVEIHPTLKIDNKETPLWFRISAEPIIIDDHKHVLLAVDDITELKKAEEEHRLADEKYRTIFENSAVAITVADDQGRVFFWG